MIAYSAQENVFLAEAGYLERIRRRVSHTRKELKAPIRFGAVENSEADLVGGIEKPPKVGIWAEGLHARRENILLSAPAGFGKSHIMKLTLLTSKLTQHVISVKRSAAKLFFVDALALSAYRSPS